MTSSQRPMRPAGNLPSRPPKREITAGIIVYRKTHEGPKFLLLYHGHSYWNFPKGHIESEEKSLAAAYRETREETGLGPKDLRLHEGFRAHERFFFKRGGQPTFKAVIFYLAETRNPRVMVSFEHQGYGWFLFRDAVKTLSKYHDSQDVLKRAYEFIRKGNGHPPVARTGGHHVDEAKSNEAESRRHVPRPPK